MNYLHPFTLKELNALVNFRKGETKYGEKVITMHLEESFEAQLQKSDAPYVLLGISEDIGVLANFGFKGTRNAYTSVIKSLLNTQHNKYNKGSLLHILGELRFDDLQKKADSLNPQKEAELNQLYDFVDIIDKEVSYWIQQIVAAGKKPIVIGGGHNNAYGIIKGCALALNKSMNVINFDAHTDLRKLEGRHSGNGFSYAYEEGFLKKYYVFGLHENYTPKTIFKNMKAQPEIFQYATFEELYTRREKGADYELNKAIEFIKGTKFGVEIDCDAIEGVPSSAMTPSGFH